MKEMVRQWRRCLQGRARCDLFYVVWLCWGGALLLYVLGSDAYLWPVGFMLLVLFFWLVENIRMFKRKRHSVAAAPNSVTVIAAGARFQGDLLVEGDLDVHGQLVGTLRLVGGVLRIMQGGRIEGEVDAHYVIINGLLDGTCRAAEVEILENGKMQGVLKGGCLSICKGGHFIGHSHPGEAVVTEAVAIAAPVNQKGRGPQVKEKSHAPSLPKALSGKESEPLAKPA